MQVSKKIKTILVLDDDPNLLDVVGLYLEDAGYRAILCSDPLETEKLLDDSTIHAVVCDYQMPKRNGLECLRIIRNKLGNEFPVLLMTGLKEISDQVSGQHYGFKDFSGLLEKPFDAPTILKILNKELHKFKLVDPQNFESIHLDGFITHPPGMKSTHRFTLLEFYEKEIVIEVRRGILTQGKCCTLEIHTKLGKKDLKIDLDAYVQECPIAPLDPLTQEEGHFEICRLKIKGANEILLQRLQEMYTKKQESINEFFRKAKGLD